MKIAIIYGSATGTTESVAESIAEKIGKDNVEVFDVSNISTSDIEKYDVLILGTSTWGYGELQDDWDAFLPSLKSANLKDKTIALFGVGNGLSNTDTFVDGMSIIYEGLQNSGCKFVGEVDASDYDYEESKSVKDGKFIGLALDVDNCDDQVDEQIDNWIKAISPNF